MANKIAPEAVLPLGLVNVVFALPSGRTYDHARYSGNGKFAGTVVMGTTPKTLSSESDKAAIKAVEVAGKKIFKET